MKRPIYIYTLFFFSFLSLAGDDNGFLQENKILPANEAFKINVMKEGNEIIVSWDIKEKYYLYADSIKIKQNQNLIKHRLLIGSKNEIEDEFFGKTEIFKNILKISVTAKSNNAEYEVLYQGCAELGVCYPIQRYLILNSYK